MASEGGFPKANGDVFYGSELNMLEAYELGAGTFGDGSDGALNVTSGTTTITSPLRQYTTFSISNGATLAFSGIGKCVILVQGDATITGTITLPDRAGTYPTTFDNAAGSATVTAATGNGVMLSRMPPIIFKLPIESSNGGVGGTVGTPGAAGTGKAIIYLFVGGSLTVNSTAQINGNGGNGGNGSGGASHQAAGGGGGGGAANFLVFARKNITVVAGATFNLTGGTGGNGDSKAYYPGGVDEGAGGGGGASYASNGGAGGAAGGGNNKPPLGAGGGGGAGGMLYLLCGGTFTDAGTYNTGGGAGGTSGRANGSTGSAGLVMKKTLQYTQT